MRYCKKCVMPDTRPGIVFNERGICQGCIAEEKKDKTNWKERYQELVRLCEKYRKINGDWYDCIIAVSGGKDSHFQTHVMKELMNMNPLLVTVEDNFPMTKAGKHNIKNISEEFGCDIVSLKPNIKVQKKLMRYCFEKYAKPNYYLDILIYSYPIHIAIKFGIPLIVYGENVNYEYGGAQKEETYSALEQFYNDVASGIPLDELCIEGITLKDLNLCLYPTLEEMKQANLEPIYLSYFMRWSTIGNYNFSKKRGFRDLSNEWKRSMMVCDFEQVDSRAYMIHPWLKYPKFGHGLATDMASRFIRYGLITREEGIELIKSRDFDLDNLAIYDFCEFLGYSITEFWDVVEKFYNRELFEKNIHGNWKLKNPIWQ
ncbi:MAG: N-acetyl sugar amidotransferase [Candidatus Hermodarchaeota archaeon]